ncbi:hypothetical protein AZE99_03965 [Sphingorhabdus sp. M41]|nr:hypothetical protein AZE99_03965 [Sphingorhabdus sp. M41]
MILLAISLLSLSACEKDFDEKYQDNLDQLNAEAKAIESGVIQHLAEGRQADEIIQSAEGPNGKIQKKDAATQ